MISFFYLMILTTSVFIFLYNRSYLYYMVILELLSLEVLYVIFFYSSIVTSLGDFLMMLTLVTSEAALGLTLIVVILRVNGCDMVSNKNMVSF
nr:NADH dehydrogenase subunit 4L [Physella acuta]WID87916.1 NADH dehydrogenase subunit 4L [Physella acuta]WJL98008.1 NADH dehydrogenase subunit 4L [Physella acuta]WJL98021.1 NADH dehydrogenase subunit 4L [Physella acuta]WJL98034.1 NADH dehydrogenase subunit 4L [Physella acuta]